MNRREVLRVLGASALLPALPGRSAERLGAAGRRIHARARSRGLQVLDPHQSETVATIAELIIPTTDTPGARAAQVHRFIDLLLAEWAPDDDRKQFLDGLADVVRACAAPPTARISSAQPRATRGDPDCARRRHPDASGGETGYLEAVLPADEVPHGVRLLHLEVGATAELHYEVIPGSYDGCTDLRRMSAGPGDF